MSRAFPIALAFLALAAAGCRPSADRTEAQQAGQAAAGTGATPARSGDPVKRGANTITEETLPNNLATSVDDGDEAVSNAADVPAPAGAPTIPSQYRGRWGMVPADCTSNRGDAKGLIRIGERTIRFYEATATLQEQRPAIATSFSATFVFTGEGQTWERAVTLTRTGDSLVRAQEDGTFTYTRCAS